MPAAGGNPGQPQFVRMDSVEAAGSYSPSQIAIQHALLLRGKTRIALSGTLDASPRPQAAFDANSVVHARIDAANVDVADVQPLLVAAGGPSLPLAGAFSARIQADGPLHAPAASGSIEMDRGSLYGEPFTQLRIEGAMANQVLKVTSATLSEAGGTVSASGSYDIRTRGFQAEAHGAGFDISRIGWVRQQNLDATGKLGFSITGSGTLDDPRLEGRAAVSAFTLAGQRFGTLEATAHTTGHTLTYNVNAQLEEAALALRGETALEQRLRNQGPVRLLPIQHWCALQDGAHGGVQRPIRTGRHGHGRGAARAPRAASRRSAAAGDGGDHRRRPTAKRGRRARHAGQWTHLSRSSAHHR